MNTQLIDFERLPSVCVYDLDRLPRVVCVYFALNDKAELLYIGKAVNLYHRWRNHHKMERLAEFGFAKLCWVESDRVTYSGLEFECIKQYTPSLNGRRHVGKPYAIPEKAMTESELDKALERTYPIFSKYYGV